MMSVISTGYVTMYVGIVAHQRTAKMYKRYSHRCTGSNGGITVQCMCISYSHPSHLYKYSTSYISAFTAQALYVLCIHRTDRIHSHES